MARYDRIARIDAPSRDEVFSCWLTLRDLEGREREPELGRRARLHFLALRPVRRLLLRGTEGTPARSFDSQLHAVRSHVEQLPADDAARTTLIRYLEEIGGRAPAGLVRATVEVGAAAEAAGHCYAAEEFYRTAIELAEAHGLVVQRIAALRSLGRVQQEREEWDEALATLQESADLAEAAGEATEWARSTEALAAVHVRRGDVRQGRAALDAICESPSVADDSVARAVALGGLCALELREGNLDAALDAGWSAVRILPPADEARNRVLLNMAAAFRRLGLLPAASSCYQIIVRWAAWPEHRIEARLESALVAADSGQPEVFDGRREAVMSELGQADRPLRAMVHLGLGRGALHLGRSDQAREHIREAIATARDIGADELLERAESLAGALDTDRSLQPPKPVPASPEAAGIAEHIKEIAAAPAA